MSEDKNHSEAYERYLKGKMSPAEAHAFEREVLDDPFAREAIEGLESLDPEQAVRDIQSLKRKVVKGKRAFSTWKIAAMISLTLVSTFLIFQVTKDLSPQLPVSLHEPAQEKSDVAADSLALNAPIKKLQKKDGVQVVDKDEEAVNNYLEQESEPLAKPLRTAEKESAKTASSNFAEKEGESVVDLPEVAEEEVTIPPAELLAVGKEADSDNQDILEIQADESGISENETLPLAKTSTMRSALRQTSTNSKPQKKIKNSIKVPAAPTVGDSLYRQYLQRMLIYPDSARKSNLSGEVVLKLIINPTGGIEHIQIEKGLGYGCDKEAIRLIEGGPIWKPATIDHVPVKDTISITVKFNHSE